MSPVWQTCFEMAWEAYCQGSFPVGAVIIDQHGKILVKERNRRFDQEAPPGLVCSTNLAHAELNALITLGRSDPRQHPHINGYRLYSTMEPCPLCFSAFYLSGVRTLDYAARDNYGGSTNLYGATEYFTRKTIAIHGPDRKMEEIQLVLAVDYVRRRFKGPIIDTLVDAWRQDCPSGVALGEQWLANKTLQQLSQQQTPARTVVNAIAGELEKEMG